MIRKISLLALLGLFVFSCKSKKKVTYGQKNRTYEVTVKKEGGDENPEKDALNTLPEDDGKFVRYEIGSVDAYIDLFSETAQLEMKAYGIPASITLAQGLLESGLGKGELALKTNNHFGIKCHTNWTGDYELHDDDEKDECFRKYNHPMYSYRDHSVFLSTRSRYAFLFELDEDDYKGWAKGLRKAGYATDKKYPQKLISLIERYELYQYDTQEGSSARQKEVEVLTTTDGSTGNSRITAETPAEVTSESVKPITHVVVKGDSLWALSRKYGVTVAQLRKLNNMSGNGLSIGQLLVVKQSR
ncbi:LysM peptidoglycan-binding domain-containing protein [Aggregatimonas sangjinii]|uniref:Peptidoglycan hydrolase n=1 Tax=Aggregatimonas sangjinii TaxID=2583587 RepID=A0A5B7SPC3_9FLAO|nr:glucosaminidase domain-containing protein [Aggregatimonas sangjinii]QCW98850.1 LysM peptidoglycan-binding domain-containing protein [Aggregatimonas sangjinii]